MTVMNGRGKLPRWASESPTAAVVYCLRRQPAGVSAFCDLFPARIRYTGAAVGFNIGNVIGGGFALTSQRS